MSISIHWNPIVKTNTVPTLAPSSTWATLREIMDGDELNTSHLPALRALAKADSGSGAWPALIKAIEKNDTILLSTSS
jgi:hypothetical protein